MKAIMRFSHNNKAYEKGDDVDLQHEDDVNYLLERKLIEGDKPEGLTPESKSLSDKELADLTKSPEKKKISTVKEKKEIDKP
jgi:hypothetical protein